MLPYLIRRHRINFLFFQRCLKALKSLQELVTNRGDELKRTAGMVRITNESPKLLVASAWKNQTDKNHSRSGTISRVRRSSNKSNRNVSCRNELHYEGTI